MKQRGGLIRRWLALASLVFVFVPLPAVAHESGIVEIAVNPSRQTLSVEIDITDLDLVLNLRESGNEITWGDLQHRTAIISDYLLGRLSVSDCDLRPQRLGVRANQHPRLVYNFDMVCVGAAESVKIRSQILDELPDYRSVLRVEQNNSERLQMFTQGETVVSVVDNSPPVHFRSFVAEGIRHILQGADHLVFLLLLVLPLAGHGTFAQRSVSAGVIVTAFTVSHSITLSLSTIGNLYLPAAPVELLIAGSVVLVAVMNLVGNIEKLAWPIAYVFGLIHGFGFAGAFADLAAGRGLHWTDLLAFNLGVEIGQIAIIIIALLLMLLLESRKTITRNLAPIGSVIAGCAGLFWIVQRL